MNESDIFLLIIGSGLAIIGLAIMLVQVFRMRDNGKENEAEPVPFSTNLSGVLVDFSGMSTLFQPSEQIADPANNPALENDF